MSHIIKSRIPDSQELHQTFIRNSTENNFVQFLRVWRTLIDRQHNLKSFENFIYDPLSHDYMQK